MEKVAEKDIQEYITIRLETGEQIVQKAVHNEETGRD